MLFIVWEDDEGTHREPLRPEGNGIGRAEDNTIRMAHISVSRHHAKIWYEDARWLLRDLGSSNGTRLDGQGISEHEVGDGDALQFGDITAKLSQQEGSVVTLTKADQTRDGTPIHESSIVLNAAHLSGRARKTAGFVGDAEADTGDMLATLVTVAQEMLSTSELHPLLEGIAQQIFRYIPVEDAFILLHDVETDELVTKLSRARKGGAPRTDISSSIVRRSFRHGESILTLDAGEDPRFADGASIRTQGIRSVMCVPLLASDHPLGVIFVDCTTRKAKLNQHHLHFLTLLAGMAATAVEQARLQAAIAREMALKERLMRYHSPTLVNELIASPAGAARLEPMEREVSVLFADMVGFSSRTENMPPREVAFMLTRFFSDLVEVIFEFEGTLDKFIGDAVMAIFGAPNYQEDHAERAVRCAIRMQECLQGMSHETGPVHGSVSVRIGINSGLAVVGDIGSNRRMEYTVLGNTVNIASRLESYVSSPGDIVIGPRTYDAVGDRIPCIPLGAQALKGINEPIHAYCVERAM